MRNCLVAVVLLCATAAHSATFVVDRYDDDNGSCTVGDCTLREALLAAEATPEIDTILVPEGRYVLSIPETIPASLLGGDLEILDFDVDIVALDRVTIDAQGSSRVFRFLRSRSRLENMEITGGDTAGLGGGVYSESSELELMDVWIHDNEADAGAGLAIEIGTVMVANSTISNNESRNESGGVYIFGVGLASLARLEVTNSTISGNTARTAGGALVAVGTSFLVFEYTTVFNNTNRAGDSTMSGFLHNPGVEARYTLVEGTCEAGPDTSCMYLTSRLDQVPVPDLGLEPLALNGGSSPTHRLQAASPALDVVPMGAICPGSDQRGFVRPVDGDGDDVAACDAGAFELAPIEIPVAVPVVSPTGLAAFIGLLLASAVWRLSTG